jgi:N-acetyl-anhydromuramyl-L-alanine amidase AmpD
MPDNDRLQIDPSSNLIPVTGQGAGGASIPAQALQMSLQDLSGFLPQKQQQGQPQPNDAGSTTPMPNVISMPADQGFSKGRGGNKIQGIVLHSSDGIEKSDVNTLRGNDPTHRVSANYYVTRDGRVYQFVNDDDTAWHAGQTIDNSRYGNSATIGIEQEHVDGKQDWPKAQVQASAALVASLRGKYSLGQDQIFAHSQVAPERKQDPVDYPWKTFNQYVTQGLTARAPQVASQNPSSTGATWQNLSQFLTR